MALVECKVCRRAFINGPEGEENCPECIANLSEIYPVVRNFLRDNEKRIYTTVDVSKILGIDIKMIEGLVTMGLIQTPVQPNNTSNNKPLKINVATSDKKASQEVRTAKGGSSMHKYTKKNWDSKRKGDK